MSSIPKKINEDSTVTMILCICNPHEKHLDREPRTRCTPGIDDDIRVQCLRIGARARTIKYDDFGRPF